MKFCWDFNMSFDRKKLLFGLTVIYSVIFACILYVYGWNFLPVFKFQGILAASTGSSSAVDVVLEYEESNSTKILVHRQLDIHLEDPVFGHVGHLIGNLVDHTPDRYNGKTVVAIGGGITSARLSDVSADNMKSKFQFFSVLLPSFCRTASKVGYHYNFYLAYDSNDGVFSRPSLLMAFQKVFDAMKNSECLSVSMDLHFVECQHSGHPAWAQNDAMMEAYIDGSEYYYRVNDDSLMQTSGWTDVFVKRLAAYNPPNIGVVGPKHSGGNQLILTYDFVHRTHIDVFGFYYPRVFTDWYADDWITKVYLPDRSTKIKTVQLQHTMKLGQRYKNDYSLFPKLDAQLQTDMKILNRYVSYRQKAELPSPNHTKIISMSLFGKDPQYTWGAIRNAQLLPVVFPGWTLRVYVPYYNTSEIDLDVPPRIIACLKRLGVQVVYVKPSTIRAIPPRYWRYLVADDESVDYFLIRNSNSRLSDRDAVAVNDWIDSAESVHCIRDQPSHETKAVVDGLWGGKTKDIHDLIGGSMHGLLSKYFDSASGSVSGETNISSTHSVNGGSFLSENLWPLVASASLCHDSRSCRNWTRTISFPLDQPADVGEYLGQTYNEHHILVSKRINRAIAECSGRGKVNFEVKSSDQRKLRQSAADASQSVHAVTSSVYTATTLVDTRIATAEN